MDDENEESKGEKESKVPKNLARRVKMNGRPHKDAESLKTAKYIDGKASNMRGIYRKIKDGSKMILN